MVSTANVQTHFCIGKHFVDTIACPYTRQSHERVKEAGRLEEKCRKKNYEREEIRNRSSIERMKIFELMKILLVKW